MLCVPGLTGSKEDFLPVLPSLAAAGLSAVAVDLYGQYESAGSGDPAAYSLADLGRDLLDARAALAGPVHLIGHSFGGLTAREAVLADPTAFASLILLGSGPGALPDGRRRPLTQALAAGAMQLSPEQAWDVVVSVRTAEGMWPPPTVAEAEFLRERWVATQPAHFAGCAAVLLDAPDRTAELAASGLPVAVIHGADEDAWPPPVQASMAERLGVTATVIAAAAHSPAHDQPQATADALIAAIRAAGG